MDLFGTISSYIKGRLKIRPASLKHNPLVKPGHEQAAADAINHAVSVKVDEALAIGPGVAINALHLHPDQLKGAPGIADHALVAELVNAVVESKLQDLHKQ